MQVVQRVERISGRVISPPRLLGPLRLWSSSETHSVRLVVAKIWYLDDQWRPMKLEDSRTEGTFKFTTYGIEWLDPGQEAIHAIDVAFPAEALKPRKLTRLRLEIGYVPGRDVQFRRVDREPVGERSASMQVTAFSTPARPEWRWRICDYGGEIIEESHDRFLTIAAAVAQGAERLAHMDAVDRAKTARGDSPTVRRRGR
jgi:hypothetical protein